MMPYKTVRGIVSHLSALLVQTARMANFTRCGFHHSVHAVWNSPSRTVLESASLTVLQPGLKNSLVSPGSLVTCRYNNDIPGHCFWSYDLNAGI